MPPKRPFSQPHFVIPDGRGVLSVHALVVDTPTKRIISRPVSEMTRNERDGRIARTCKPSFLRDLQAAGFARETFDVALCTHLHVDHVGWNTMLVDGEWKPTFPRAGHLLNKTEYEYWTGSIEPQPGGFEEVQRLALSDLTQPVVRCRPRRSY